MRMAPKYKLNVQRWPLLVFGTTDLDSTQHFHMVALMLCKNETEDDYRFGFNAIKTAMDRVHNRLFEPKYLMADAAAAIHNGFRKVYGDNTTVLMCFVHMKRNVEKNKTKLIAKENLQPILTDIDNLKMAFAKDVFDVGCKLFLEKWQTDEPAMMQYISDEWITQNGNWYNGAAIRTPTDNNALENYNGKMKVYDTEFQRKGLNQFKEMMLDIVSQRSRRYAHGDDLKPYQLEATIPNQMVLNGDEYAQIKDVRDRHQSDGTVKCFMSKGDCADDINDGDVDAYLESLTTHETFDEFVEHMFDFYMITFDKDPNDWKKASCTCPAFASSFICKHILCIAMQLELLERPKKDDPKYLQSNRKRGRPAKARRGGLNKD